MPIFLIDAQTEIIADNIEEAKMLTDKALLNPDSWILDHLHQSITIHEIHKVGALIQL